MEANRDIVELTALSGICVGARQPARIKNGRGLELRVEVGSIWITQEHCTEDVYVRAGDSYCIERDGLTLVSAVKGTFAMVALDPSIPVTPTLAERLWDLWAALFAPRPRPTTAAL
jgi:hypothetical protein